jgi:hypothetical protein
VADTAYDSTLADAMSDYWVAFAAGADLRGSGSWEVAEVASVRPDDGHVHGARAEIAAKRDLRLYDSLDAAGRLREIRRNGSPVGLTDRQAGTT